MKKELERTRVRLVIEGRVQGVFFRASTAQEAQRLAVTGWVRNCPDGSVEVVAEGLKSKVAELISWCHHGPPGAMVSRVRQHLEAFGNEFDRFGIRR